jgi:hypothetical protein
MPTTPMPPTPIAPPFDAELAPVLARVARDDAGLQCRHAARDATPDE